MVVLISIHVVLVFDIANLTYIDLDKRILLHIHEIYYLVYLPKEIFILYYMIQYAVQQGNATEQLEK